MDLRYIVDHWHTYLAWIKRNAKDITTINSSIVNTINSMTYNTGTSNLEIVYVGVDGVTTTKYVNIPAGGGGGALQITYVLNYSAISTAVPTPTLHQFVYAENSQGTAWLPGSMGGTYYGAGLYMWNGVNWVNDKDEIYTALNAISISLAGKADILNTAFGISWDADITHSPSANVLYDKILVDNNNLIKLAQATLQTGLVSSTDSFSLIALNDTTLRIGAVNSAFFYDLLTVPESAIKSFAQQDYALSSLGLVTDGIYIRYVGYDSTGVINISTSPFTIQTILPLGTVLVKVDTGVTTFLDGFAGVRNVFSSPAMASNSSIDKAIISNSSNVKISPNTNTTVKSSAGTLKGISIAWGTSDINQKAVAANAVLSFAEINPSSATNSVPPTFGTTVSTTQYWNGSTMVNLTGGQSVVKRWLLAENGQFYLQEGEVLFSNLTDAKNGISTALFTDIFPFVEICRTAVERNASNLADDAKVFFLNSGGGGSGSSSSSSILTKEVEIDFGSTPINNKTFTITDALIASTNIIYVMGSPNAPTGLYGNPWEVDSAMFTALAGAGDFTLYVNTQFSITGKRKIFYQTLN